MSEGGGEKVSKGKRTVGGEVGDRGGTRATGTPGKRTLVDRVAPPPHVPRLQTDTKRSVRYVLAKKKLTAGLSVEARGELALKDKGNLGAANPSSRASLGTAETILEKHGEAIRLRLTSAVVKGASKLFDTGDLESPLDIFTVSIESKALEGGLSIGGAEGPFDLKLLTIAAILDGDLAKLLDKSVSDHAELKASVRVEYALGAGTAKKLVSVARATYDAQRASAVGEQLGKAKRRLAAARKVPNNLAATLTAEKDVTRLRALKTRYGKLVRSSSKAAAKAVAGLSKLPGGKLITKIAKKALSKALTKFVPILNVLSTAQDLVDVVSFLASYDWDSEDGGAGGGGGEDGAEAGSGAGAGPAGEGMDMGAADGARPGTIDVYEQEATRREQVILHPAAQQVVDALAGNGSGGATLSTEDTETIDFLVPRDLSADELAQVKRQLAQPGRLQVDLVDAVIMALHEVRPGGEKSASAVAPVDGSASQSMRAPASVARPPARVPASAQAPRQQGQQAGRRSPVVDPAPVFNRMLTFGSDGGPRLPPRVEFDGIEVTPQSVAQGMLLTVTDAPLIRVDFVVTRAWPGARLADGTLLNVGVRAIVLFDRTAKIGGTR